MLTMNNNLIFNSCGLKEVNGGAKIIIKPLRIFFYLSPKFYKQFCGRAIDLSVMGDRNVIDDFCMTSVTVILEDVFL